MGHHAKLRPSRVSSSSTSTVLAYLPRSGVVANPMKGLPKGPCAYSSPADAGHTVTRASSSSKCTCVPTDLSSWPTGACEGPGGVLGKPSLSVHLACPCRCCRCRDPFAKGAWATVLGRSLLAPCSRQPGAAHAVRTALVFTSARNHSTAMRPCSSSLDRHTLLGSKGVWQTQPA